MNDKLIFAGKAKDARHFFESKAHEFETFDTLLEEAPEFPKFEYYIEDDVTAQDLIDNCSEEIDL